MNQTAISIGQLVERQHNHSPGHEPHSSKKKGGLGGWGVVVLHFSLFYFPCFFIS